MGVCGLARGRVQPEAMEVCRIRAGRDVADDPIYFTRYMRVRDKLGALSWASQNNQESS